MVWKRFYCSGKFFCVLKKTVMCSQRFLCSRKHYCVLRRIVASKEKLSRVLPLWATVESHPLPLTQYKKKKKNSCRRLDPEKKSCGGSGREKNIPASWKSPTLHYFSNGPSLIRSARKDVDCFRNGSVHELYCLKTCQIRKVHARYLPMSSARVQTMKTLTKN